jgi:uncharacterized membrane protein AbrB (regulator of aidB expression)
MGGNRRNAVVVLVAIVSEANSREHERAQEKRDQQMRIFVALAITVGAAIGLGGCFWHHQAAAVAQPVLKPLK